MRRFARSVLKDATLQFRGGFYLVGALVTVFYVVLLLQIPADWRAGLPLLVPAALSLNALITTFFFVGALVLLERSEGVLAAIAVTPLRTVEYLGAKVVTLGFLALSENLLIVVLVYGTGFVGWQLGAGLALLCAFYTLLGFAAISRFESINRYLIPSVLFVVALSLPLLRHFGVTDSPLMYLHPVQPFLSLLGAAFLGAPRPEVVYGLLGAALWTAAAYALARRAYAEMRIR